jgi:hypothetical protein
VAGNPLVSGARLTNTATLTFQYNGPVLAETPEGAYPTQTVDILYDSSNVSSQSQTLRFFSSGYRLLPGAFNTSVIAEPSAANFTDIDLVRSPALAPYLTTPNGTLQLGTVTFTTASPVLATDPKPFVVLRNTTTADRITVTNAGTVAILENLVASTISGAFSGNGDLIKTGGGVLQYQGSAGRMFNYSVALPYSYIQTPFGFFLSNPGTNNIYGLRPIDLSPNVPVPDPTNGNNWRLSGLQGRVQVDAGLLDEHPVDAEPVPMLEILQDLGRAVVGIAEGSAKLRVIPGKELPVLNRLRPAFGDFPRGAICRRTQRPQHVGDFVGAVFQIQQRQPDDHVFPGTNRLWCSLGELIGLGQQPHVRVFFRDASRDVVDEGERRSGVGTLALGDGGALRAAAVFGTRVVLGERIHPGRRRALLRGFGAVFLDV